LIAIVPAFTLLLEPGESLVVFTDGIAEGRNGDGEAFGVDRLAAALDESCASAADVRDRVRDALTGFAGRAEPADDVTLLVVRRTQGRTGA
jgi:sigma-B regulation protein RsbU (phosphoserine phosphatase)